MPHIQSSLSDYNSNSWKRLQIKHTKYSLLRKDTVISIITWIGWIQPPVQRDNNNLNITGDICDTPNQNTQTSVPPAALNVWDIL